MILNDLAELDRENLYVLHLDSKNHPVALQRSSIGTETASFASPPSIFRAALHTGATRVILVHNHPSGDPAMSEEDLRVARQIEEAGSSIGIQLLDFLVVGSDGEYSSARDMGVM